MKNSTQYTNGMTQISDSTAYRSAWMEQARNLPYLYDTAAVLHVGVAWICFGCIFFSFLSVLSAQHPIEAFFKALDTPPPGDLV